MTAKQALRVESTHFSYSGGRDYNEDALADCEAFGAVRLFMLADGAGGMGGGAVAAQTALASAKAEFLGLPTFADDTLKRIIAKADEAVRDRQSAEPGLSRMAATFVGLLVSYQNSQALIGNLGDSRCYVFRDDAVIAQSYDHSLVQRFVDAGLYPLDKLRQHPKRNVLYASLGANAEDIAPYLSQTPIDLIPGDGLLLCSDGVWELLDETLLGQLHAAGTTVDLWRDGLVGKLQERMPPGHDNFSAILVRCMPADPVDEDDLSTIGPGLA